MKIPDLIQLEELPPFCWVEVSPAQVEKGNQIHCNLRKSLKDPLIRYVVILRTGQAGYEYYLIDYFNQSGQWITQLAFDDFQTALDQIEYEFLVDSEDWNYCDLAG